MKRTVALLIAPLLIVLSGCDSSTAKVNNLTADEFASDIKNSGVVVLDVRTPGEFAAGHIANAINIDVEAANFDTKIANLDKNVEYAVYCHSGRRSAIATETMAKAGFKKLTNLTNGVNDWLASGYPLVTN